jgi:hypothetical protein
MAFPHVLTFNSSGGPLIIADAANLRHWTGREPDDKGVTVSYWGQGLEALPQEFSVTKAKGGERTRSFPSLEEARKFEERLLLQLKKLHPEAARPPKYPDYPTYYVGATRVFGIERKFSSQFDDVLKKLKGEVASISFDKKHKATALFYDAPAGPAWILADESMSSIAIAGLIADDGDRIGDMTPVVERMSKKPKPSGKMKLSGSLIVFNAAFAARRISEVNWRTADISEGVATTLERNTTAPVRIPDQAPPGGGCLRVPAGTYSYGVARGGKAKTAVVDALWLWRE